VWIPSHNFWSSLILKGEEQGCEIVDDIVGDVTVFVFCFRRGTTNFSYATAGTVCNETAFQDKLGSFFLSTAAHFFYKNG
jgi:hypothetical protein